MHQNTESVINKQKVGIIALSLEPFKSGGVEVYLLNLLNGFRHQIMNFDIYIFCTNKNYILFEQFKNDYTIVVINDYNVPRKLILLYEWLFIFIPLYRWKIDLAFFPFGYRYIFKLKSIKTVSVIHDIQHKILPKLFSNYQKLLRSFFINLIVGKSDRIVCISNSSKIELIKFYPISKSKITVIYNPIDFESLDEIEPYESFHRKSHLDKDYVLFIGSFFPHKNVELLIRAFKLVVQDDPKTILILAGMKQTDDSSVKNLINHLNLNENIKIIGYFDSNLKGSLYEYAKLFVFPSIYEGFGMPVVEAMYKKLPVITTKLSCLPEISQNMAIYLNDLSDEKELSKLIIDVLSGCNFNCDYSKISIQIESCYNTSAIAKQYIDLFENVFVSDAINSHQSSSLNEY